MDVQAAPPTYTPVGGQRPPSGNPPILGQQVPGMSGGLPSQGGLSVLSNPMAQQLQSQMQPQAPTQPNANAQSSVYRPSLERSEFEAKSAVAPDQAAQQTQQYGRGEDTMLVHMTPNEVNSLQGLAMAHGGSLTINPHTGLPEAGWLGNLLPTLLGGVLAATGVGAPLAAGLVGLGQTALTGDLSKGLMAGLGAFGGASLAGAAGLGGAISNNAFGALGSKAGILGANMGAGAIAPTLTPGVAGQAVQPALDAAKTTLASQVSGQPVLDAVAQQAAASQAAIPQVAQATAGGPGFFGRFAQTASRGLPGGIPSKIAPGLAGMGLLNSLSGAATSPGGGGTSREAVDNSYQGPYTAQRRTATFAPSTDELLASSAERRYFDVAQPEIYNMQGQVVQPGSNTAPGTPIVQTVLNPKAKKGQPMYSYVTNPYMQGREEATLYAEGGEVQLSDGAFVVDARTVSELGNGSSSAGQELLARMGGRPVRGPGDGVSDSIPARIGRDQPARVARDEVVFPAQAVRRMGGGDSERGANKLYALMDKAHKARKKAARGGDTKLRKGLA